MPSPYCQPVHGDKGRVRAGFCRSQYVLVKSILQTISFCQRSAFHSRRDLPKIIPGVQALLAFVAQEPIHLADVQDMVAYLYRLLQSCHHRQPGVGRDLNVAALHRFHFDVVFSYLMGGRAGRAAASHNRARQTRTGDGDDDLSHFTYPFTGVGLFSSSKANHWRIEGEIRNETDRRQIGGAILILRTDQSQRVGGGRVSAFFGDVYASILMRFSLLVIGGAIVINQGAANRKNMGLASYNFERFCDENSSRCSHPCARIE